MLNYDYNNLYNAVTQITVTNSNGTTDVEGINPLHHYLDLGTILTPGENTITIKVCGDLENRKNASNSAATMMAADAPAPPVGGPGGPGGSSTSENGLTNASLNLYTVGEVNKIDKHILEQVIANAEECVANGEVDNAITSVQKSFNEALENAKAVYQDESASQIAVDQAWLTLLKEIQKLGFIAGDTTNLNLLIEYAESLVPEQYVDFSAVETALNSAKEVVPGEAMKDEVQQATDTLLNALLDLRLKADKSILEQVIAEANSKDATAYTAESYAVLTSAVEKATNVLADENATQQDVDTAVESVQTAMDGLVALSGTSVEAPTENNAVDQTTQTGQETTTTKANAAKTGDVAPIAMVVTLATAASALVLLNKKRK